MSADTKDIEKHLPSDQVLLRLVEEYTAREVRDILLAMHGIHEPIKTSESPWPMVAFYLAAGAVLCTLIIVMKPH